MMKCPIDETQLVMTERQGVEIDYCPKCRGVWLDRGELDKILERASGPGEPGGARFGGGRDDDDGRRGQGWRGRDNDDDDDRRGGWFGGGDGDDDDRGQVRGQGQRRRSFLSDIFEF